VADWSTLSNGQRLEFWDESERLLIELLRSCSSYLAEDQKRMVQELVDHNEHQLALEFLFDYLDEETRSYPAALVEQFRALDNRLHLTGGRDLNRLSGKSPKA
jgi:hypothetical protein